MYINKRFFIIFQTRNIFPIYFFVSYIIILLINTIHSRQTSLSREDTSPHIVAPQIIELINENYKGKKGENNIYLKNLGDYSLELKFLYLDFAPEEINIDIYKTGNKFFSYIDIYMDFIFSLKIIKDQKNNDNGGVSIIYNSKTNTTNFSFQLKNIFANIYIKYIEFEKQPNNTYQYKNEKPEIIIYRNSYNYPENINKFLISYEHELELFLFESFDNYLTNITDHYPKADGILLYETVVLYIKSSFQVNDIPDSSKKIVFKEFKEEKIYVEESTIVISNIKVKFDIVYSFYYTESYEKILPSIKFFHDKFYFNEIDITIEGIQLKSVIEDIFDFIIKYYIEEY